MRWEQTSSDATSPPVLFSAPSPTLSVGLMAVAFACVVGTVLGILAAMSRVWISTMIMRATDLMLAFPWFLLILTIVSVLGPGLENVILALSVAMVPHYIRLARGLALSVREREFVQAAVLIGESPFSVQTRYILPNCASPLLVQVTLDIPITIMAAAALGFLGLGAQPPMPEWGCDAERSPGIHADRSACRGRSRARPRPGNTRLQPAWRHDARCPGSANGGCRPMTPPLLEIRNLRLELHTERGVLRVFERSLVDGPPGKRARPRGERPGAARR